LSGCKTVRRRYRPTFLTFFTVFLSCCTRFLEHCVTPGRLCRRRNVAFWHAARQRLLNSILPRDESSQTRRVTMTVCDSLSGQYLASQRGSSHPRGGQRTEITVVRLRVGSGFQHKYHNKKSRVFQDQQPISGLLHA